MREKRRLNGKGEKNLKSMFLKTIFYIFLLHVFAFHAFFSCKRYLFMEIFFLLLLFKYNDCKDSYLLIGSLSVISVGSLSGDEKCLTNAVNVTIPSDPLNLRDSQR